MTKLKAIIQRRWPILLVAVLLGAVAGVLSAPVASSRGITAFDAQQLVIVNRIPGNPANVSQDVLKFKRGAVLDRTAEILGDDQSKDVLASRVTASANTESLAILVNVRDTDPDRGSRTVQAFVQAFLEVVNEELRVDVNGRISRLEERLAEAEADLVAFDEANGFLQRPDLQLPPTVSVDNLIAERNRLVQAVGAAQTQLDTATLAVPERDPYGSLPPDKPVPSAAQLIEVPESPIFRAGLLGAIALLMGSGLVLLIERVNSRIDTRDELAELISVPIIAEIGKIPRRSRSKGNDPSVSLDGVWSEHYRRVRSAIEFVQADAAARAERAEAGLMKAPSQPDTPVIAGHRTLTGEIPRVLMFVSALPGEGKSTSVALTAMALAETGHETLVINADFRRPKVEAYLDVKPRLSLADRAELSDERPEIDDLVEPAGRDHLWIAGSGKPTAEVGRRIEAAKEVAAEAASRGATVLIDSSPLRVSNDPIDLLSAADEVVLVVRAGRTTVKSIEDTMELLDMHHAPTMGVILIGTLATREMYAYYASYYQEEQRRAAAAGADSDQDSDPTQGSAAEDVGSSIEQAGERPAKQRFLGASVRSTRPDVGPVGSS